MTWWSEFKDSLLKFLDPGMLGYLVGLAVLCAAMVSPFLLLGYLTNWR
jgi:hypothetical protein